MADNVTLPGTGVVVRTKDRTTSELQIIGIDLNAGGSPENLMVAGQRTMANSMPVVLSNDHSTVPVSNYEQSSTICIGSTTYTVKRAAIAVSALGDSPIVAAVAAKVIRVLSMAFVVEGSVSLYFKNTTTGPIFGGSTNKISPAAGTLIVLPHNPYGWFQTGTVNEDLTMNLTAAVPTSVSGGLTYIEV